jgi:hypothetical protein
MKDTSWAKVLMRFSYIVSLISIALLVIIAIFFNRKLGVKGPVTKHLDKFQPLNQLT